jgi:amino acid adenylation domain-containing protein
VTWAPQDAGWPVSERILRWAARCPERDAIIDGPMAMTYGELATRVGALVRRLRSIGAGRDTVVALYLPPSAELVVAATAVLVAGAAYLPVDVDQPFTRTRRMLADSGARQLITMSELWSVNGDAGPIPLYIDDPALAAEPPEIPVPPEPDSLAYLTYTSGPSGAPTGVQIEHAGLTNLVDWYGECHRVDQYDTMAQLSPSSLDAFALEVWPCLAHGATLRIADRRLLSSPARLTEWLDLTEVTLCLVPAPVAEALLDLPWPVTARLRAMLVSGDGLGKYPPSDLPFRLYNNYGHTECTVVATCGEVAGAPDRPGQPPIGLPIRGITAYVLDVDLRPVDDDQPGQLYLTGTGLARGYVGPPTKTSPRFVPDPFSLVAGARMYATGDLVRRDVDGVLHFLGRTDDQIRMMGHRIEPAEIEAVLLREESVCTAVVVAHRSPTDGTERLVAYVVCVDGGRFDGAALRGRLTAELPDHLTPAHHGVRLGGPAEPGQAPAADAARNQVVRSHRHIRLGERGGTGLGECVHLVTAIADAQPKERRSAIYCGQFWCATGAGGHSLDDTVEVGVSRLVPRERDAIARTAQPVGDLGVGMVGEAGMPHAADRADPGVGVEQGGHPQRVRAGQTRPPEIEVPVVPGEQVDGGAVRDQAGVVPLAAEPVP